MQTDFRTFIEGSSDIIYESDARGFFTLVNAAATKLLGYPSHELIGRHYSDLVREDWRGATIEHYRSQLRDASATTYFEFPAVTADGRTVWIGQSVQAVIEDGKVAGFRAIARDITERRLADERFHAFMNNSPTVAFMKDAEGRYVYANDLMNRLFAKPGSTVIGLSDSDLLDEAIALPIRRNDEEVLNAHKAVQVVESAPTIDGEVRQWLTYKFPVAGADGTTFVGGAAVDLTERIDLEKKLAAARDAALASARQKAQFLANMSHEIRTPMNGVIGLIGVLLDTEVTADQRDLLSTAKSSAESLLTIINDILDFSKIEAGKLSFDVLDFDLRSACEATMDLLSDAARRKGLEIGYVVDPDVPARLHGDAGRLRQVLLNLLGNAIKFTEEGGVLLQVDSVSRSESSAVVRFRIIDTGIGMNEETCRRLFQPFSQADASTTRRFGGTGLGLAISRELVHMMDGEIDVASEPGCGSTFSFTAKFAYKEQPERPPAITGTAPRVLIVEDSTTTRHIIALQLTAWGVPNDIADDSMTAMAMLRHAATAGEPYQVVLSDFHMPGIDGAGLARIVRESKALGAPRFVLMTGANRSFDAAMTAELGVTSCLIKPVKQRHLFSAVFGRKTADEPAPAVAQTARPATPIQSKRRVLVVDDNVVNQKVTLRQLEKLGFHGDAVGSGIEALDALGRIAYDLVLMDCQMPEMDGYEATAEVRRREGDARRTPIVALTAAASDSDRTRCLDSGMDDFVTKPVRETELADALQRWMPRCA